VLPPSYPPAAGHEPPRRSRLGSWLLLLTLLVVVVAAFGAVLITRGNGSTPGGDAPALEEPDASDSGPAPGESVGLESFPLESFAQPSAATGVATPGATEPSGTAPVESAAPQVTTPPGAADSIPIVPVVSFWSTDTDVSLEDVRADLSGTGTAKTDVIVTDADADAIAQALGITLGQDVQRGSADDVRKQVGKGALGFLRVTDVDPSVRALSLDGVSLFGNDRTHDLSKWELSIPTAAGDAAWDLATTWTLVAGGDMFMDRGVYREVVKQKKGVDFPFDGGTAIVTGHHCCGQYVTTYEIPDVKLTGNAGAVRSLVKDADLAMANLETPVPDNWVYHAHDYIFSSDPALLPMFTDAGIDFVTIANNHIKNFGASGIADTRKNLAAAGLQFAGAGADLAEAGEIAYLHAAGTTVGVIGCSGVATSDNAGKSRAGVLPCTVADVVPRIAEAKKNADLVIVFAHWGTEGSNDPQSIQPPIAKAWIDAGAGLILGSHPHVPGAIDDIDGKVVFYSLGNFIFDQTFWTKEMESALPEMTFQGDRLVQIRLHPFVAPDSQPNLLDPATDDGKAIMNTIKQASQKVGLDW
jgi:poly-gamma-glutamate capsule biosynthesis protein CapA/YwtB (metallophosphatase superfamily)